MVDLVLALACLVALLAVPIAVRAIAKNALSPTLRAGGQEPEIGEPRPGIAEPEQIKSEESGNPIVGSVAIRKDNIFLNVGDGKFLYTSLFQESPMMNLTVVNTGIETENPKSENIIILDQFRNVGKSL